MAHKSNLLLSGYRLRFSQKGAVLIFLAFVLGLGAAAYMLKTFNVASVQANQDQKTYKALNEAKQALIAWAVTHRYSPGQMPWPDRNGDGNYDGSSDCSTVAFQYSVLLGQLPSLPATSPCLDPNTGSTAYAGLSTYAGLGQEFRDAQGNRLWYAVSRNLVRSYAPANDPVINPGIINAPIYQWLQVLDRNGNLISNRVAAVILAPGDALDGQNRSGAADASQFLDSFQTGAAIYNNRGYAIDDEDFIMGDDSRNVSANDPTFVQPYSFNDKLVYITIDELMAALEKRVGEQARSSLKTYQDTNGYYPYATQLGTTVNFSGEQNQAGTDGLTSGFLPANYQSCSYTISGPTNASLSCVQPIFDAASSSITEIRFYLPSGTFTSSSSWCTRQSSNTRCYCTGVGSCTSATITFSCNLSNCSAVGTGAGGDFRIRGGKLTFRSDGCVHTAFPAKDALGCSLSTNSRITCSSTDGTVASNGDVRFDNLLPAWFNQNQWGGYVYYHTIPHPPPPIAATMVVGSRNAETVVVTVGRPINAVPFALSKGNVQVRPSCNTLNNYLDSVENANGDTVYDATSTQRNASYNDQTFVVAP